ncbi:MAG TPA: hypothetical protein VFW73_00920, partial [Lacipirellulaceae bacterium]|nr:hypothetical protein [Lacipirellulaceae bacterium]
TEKYYADYANWACRRDCAEAFQQFDTKLDWSQVVVTSSALLKMPWRDVIRTVEACRHSLTHSEGRISKDKLQTLPKPIRELIESQMRTTILSDGLRIMPNADTVERIMESVFSYCYDIYRLVSLQCNWPVEYAPFEPVQKPAGEKKKTQKKGAKAS